MNDSKKLKIHPIALWTGSKEKLAAILAVVNTLSELSIESLTQHLTNEQSALSKALFNSLATPANGNKNPDEKQMQAIQDILVAGLAPTTKVVR